MKIKLLIIMIFILNIVNGQIQSVNLNNGIAFCTDIAVNGNEYYTCGSFNGQMKILDSIYNGNSFNSPFLIIKNTINNDQETFFPVQAINGYTEFKNIYVFNNEIYLTGIFTNKIVINEDSIQCNGLWNSFIIKLNEMNSVIWYKIFQSNNEIAPILKYINNKVYSANSTILKDSIFTNIYEINTNTGTISWSITKFNEDFQKLIDFSVDEDSIYVYTINKELIYRNTYSTSGLQGDSSCVTKPPGYLLNSKTIGSKNFTLLSYSNNSTYSLILSTFNYPTSKQCILQSQYFAECEILTHIDSIIYVIGYFNESLYADTITYFESDSSNSFILQYNYITSKIVSLDLLPYRNVFKAIIKDSLIYFLTNYIDGSTNSKRSNSIKISYNGDFRIYSKPYKIITKTNKYSLLTQEKVSDLVVYPNINNGDVISVCCFSENISQLYLINAIGNKVNITYSLIEGRLIIYPINQLSSGVYFVKILKDSLINTYKIIVN